MPLDEALEICCQIAAGLEAAHEKGIIHRDLKPSNIRLTPDGKVKILDFGLAKAFSREPVSEESNFVSPPAKPGAYPLRLCEPPASKDSLSESGVILGTAAYMSPEQAIGRPVDKRTDIWAFGCVLFECLTGKAPFKSETVAETMALILDGTPDWNLLPAGTPAIVRSLLWRCLQKDPGRRFHNIVDARVEDTPGSH